MLAASVLAIIVITTFKLTNNKENEAQTVEALKAKHAEFLKNSPFAKTRGLSKSERKDLGLPPNAYYEQMWELTMDPNTGRPMPERVLELQAQLREDRLAGRGVSGTTSTPWIDRGPNNQGGRTRGIMFDPNDVGNANPADDYTRVFAGGVSGGLWVNNDITSSSSSWTQLNVQANISVTTIISDPNNSNTFFIGSGESFTSGDAVGRGIWRSTDAGITWQNVLGGTTNTSGQFVNGFFYVNDIVARNNGGVTELYAAVSSAAYADAASGNFNGLNEMGLYKSVDNGNTWTRFAIQHTSGVFKNPCDIELDINNNIWFTTTGDSFGNPGGDIYRSTDGVTFSLITNIPGALRTELEPSQTSANIFWVAARVGNGADLFFTANAFSTVSPMPTEPNDADTGIPDTDFTRGQAFYDLVIEADQSDVLYVGGIDLFRTTDFGINWRQISKWSNNNNLAALQVPLVHADHHAIVFRPGSNGNQAAFGNDGGVFYGSNISSIVTSNSTTAIQARNKDYNTTHFYYGDINQVDIANGDDLVGGLQDNGTQISLNSNAGANAYVDPRTGDGAYTEISKNGDYLITSYTGETHIFSNFPSYNSGRYTIANNNRGSFINEAELDDNRHVLYTNSSSGGTNRISRYINVNIQSIMSASDLTNALLNARPTAFKINPHSTNGTPPTSTATLLVGLANGRLLKLTNADNVPVWSNIGFNGFVGSISDIEFGQNENEIFVTMFNYGVNSVWYTSNGGTSWQNKEGNLPDMPVKCILQNPLIPQEVIIGTELGVWATADITVASPVWVPVYNGMSDVTVIDLDLRATDNVILASTHGRGLFTGQFTATPLSINDNTINKNTLRIYPTVSNGNITISSTLNIGKVNLDVFSITGKKVYNTDIDLNGSSKSLKLNLSSGVYLVKFTKGTFTETKKIVVK